jgi:hypothetical protein
MKSRTLRRKAKLVPLRLISVYVALPLEAARWHETITKIAQPYTHKIFSYMVRRILDFAHFWEAPLAVHMPTFIWRSVVLSLRRLSHSSPTIPAFLRRRFLDSVGHRDVKKLRGSESSF